MIIHATIPFGQYSAKKAGGSRGEAGKTMRRRQIGLRARNKLAQLSPNSRGILANVARLPGSSNFFSILLAFFFLSRFPRSLSFHHFLPPLLFLRQKYVDALKFSADSGERSLEKSRERLVESDSNRVRTAQPWKRQTIRARSASSSGKEFRWTRESLYSTILVRACCGFIFILNVSWLLPISFYVPIFFFRSSDISFPVHTIFIGLCM